MAVPQSIVVRTLSDQVLSILRERIVTGDLPDGSPIRQDAIALELGVSKIPLREALGRLEQEGLIVSQANRGYTVRPMSAAQADDIFALRLAIEPAAAARASQHATDEERAGVVGALAALDDAMDAHSTTVAVRDRDFHIALVAPGGRSLTTQLVERLAILAERYVVRHLAPAGRGARAHRENRQIIDAWMARDGSAVERLLHGHIEGVLDDLRAQFAVNEKGARERVAEAVG